MNDFPRIEVIKERLQSWKKVFPKLRTSVVITDVSDLLDYGMEYFLNTRGQISLKDIFNIESDDDVVLISRIIDKYLIEHFPPITDKTVDDIYTMLQDDYKIITTASDYVAEVLKYILYYTNLIKKELYRVIACEITSINNLTTDKIDNSFAVTAEIKGNYLTLYCFTNRSDILCYQ